MPTQNRSCGRFLRQPSLFLGAVLLLGAGQTEALDLDFLQDEGGLVNNDNYTRCDFSYMSDQNCSSGGFGGDTDLNEAHIDGTPFLQEMIRVDGETYWHMIVGDYQQDDFVQEVFIKASSGNPNCFSGGGGWGGDNDDSPCSDSVADISNEQNTSFNMGLPYDPDTSKTGTGTANPNSTIFRQIMTDSEITYEFLKDSFSQKHRLDQTISTSDITVDFMADMRGKNFSDLTAIDPTSANYTNTLVLSGADAPDDNDGDFDTKTSSQVDGVGLMVTPYVTAGGYTYTSGSGNGGSGGSYTFVGGGIGFDETVDWSGICDPSQNPNWSGNGACENGELDGGGWD